MLHAPVSGHVSYHVVLPSFVSLLPSSMSPPSLPLSCVCDGCRVVGNVSSLTLPVWGSDCNPCLMDYVPLVHKALKDKVHSTPHY